MHHSKARPKILKGKKFQRAPTNNKRKPGLFVWQMLFRGCAVFQVSGKAGKSLAALTGGLCLPLTPLSRGAGGFSPTRQLQHFMIGKLHKKLAEQVLTRPSLPRQLQTCYYFLQLFTIIESL